MTPTLRVRIAPLRLAQWRPSFRQLHLSENCPPGSCRLSDAKRSTNVLLARGHFWIHRGFQHTRGPVTTKWVRRTTAGERTIS